MTRQAISQLFGKVAVRKPADVVLQEIKGLIASGKLKEGDQLPPERELAELLGVGRGHVREALKQLTFFGLLETRPQAGTVVASQGVRGMSGVFRSVLRLNRGDYKALMETRVLLEVHAARMAATCADEETGQRLNRALEACREVVLNGQDGLAEDIALHVCVADAGGNPVVASLLRLIMPDVMEISRELTACGNGRATVAIEEHQAIVDAIVGRDPDRAAKSMERHLCEAVAFTQSPTTKETTR